jgi:S-DNA-T family DNA segregation ATPase FtsK/SpoIIIE
MPLENPFRESRLNNSGNYRADWDVPELNQTITNWLVGEVRRLRGRKDPDPGQMIAAVTGPPGYGKTHLFGRIEHLIGHEVFFVFVPEFIEKTPPLDHIRRYVIEALFDAPDGGHSPLEMALARLCRPAFADYFAGLPPTLASRYETMSRRLADSPEAVLEIVRQVKALGPFLKLADSLLHILPHDAGIVRALALGWAPAPWNSTARRWLQGQDLPDADREALSLGEEGPTSVDVLRTIPALFGHDRPMMICCDQVEGLLKGKNADAINRLSASLMELLQAVPTQIVLNCFRDTWDNFIGGTFPAFQARVKTPAFRLEPMKREQAMRLIKGRMESSSFRPPDAHPTWPFKEASIYQLIDAKGATPRELIQLCGSLLDQWIESEQQDEINLFDTGKNSRPPETEHEFFRLWNRELDAIRQNPKRTASYLEQNRLYKGIMEALKLAQSAQRMREFGGIRIVDIADNIIKPNPQDSRPGALISLAGGTGESAQKVVVALTTIEASRSFSPYFRALLTATEDPVLGALLIHPRRDLDLGPAARDTFEKAQKAGKLRFMPLEDYPLTYHSTECLAALLERANDRDLVINGVTLSAEDCRDLVIKTGVIDNLDLFKMLGKWKRATPKIEVPVGASAGIPSAVKAESASNVVTPPGVAQPVSVVRSPEPTPSTKPVSANLDGWIEKMLAGSVRKIKLLGHDVDPDGYEIGPTFARLKVRPQGKTNFKQVCNTAKDLKISLGLEVVPIIGSQAGYISIDVQRPDRAVVSLAEALAQAPGSLARQPAFPVGQDVAGQSHWLNLADPSDCHLLVAGTTGSGKSEFLRSIIGSLASRLEPGRLQFILIDPKRVTFNLRGTSPYLKDPIAYTLDDALPLIEWCMAEMERRYKILETEKLSNVSELPPELLPRIVLIIDEFASFLEDKDSKKIVTALLKRIGAMARAAGIHLILSTQRPDKDVITPLLRENLPGRIALRVASKAGSDLILGAPDAENLLGKGDLFWKKGGELLRLQSPFVPQAELETRLKCQV